MFPFHADTSSFFLWEIRLRYTRRIIRKHGGMYS